MNNFSTILKGITNIHHVFTKKSFNFYFLLTIFRLSFTVRLKTTSGNGVILYASDVKHVDFISLYMKEGKVIFSFDCGTGEAVITSSKNYNDGQWHSVSIR